MSVMENYMNKFGVEFMGKFEIGDMEIEEFFGEEWDLINDVVNKDGWYEYVNCRGMVEINYMGDKLDNMEELRKSEREFIGVGEDDYDVEIREDFIDIEEVCYVKVGG